MNLCHFRACSQRAGRKQAMKLKRISWRIQFCCTTNLAHPPGPELHIWYVVKMQLESCRLITLWCDIPTICCSSVVLCFCLVASNKTSLPSLRARLVLQSTSWSILLKSAVMPIPSRLCGSFIRSSVEFKLERTT